MVFILSPAWSRLESLLKIANSHQQWSKRISNPNASVSFRHQCRYNYLYGWKWPRHCWSELGWIFQYWNQVSFSEQRFHSCLPQCCIPACLEGCPYLPYSTLCLWFPFLHQQEAAQKREWGWGRVQNMIRKKTKTKEQTNCGFPENWFQCLLWNIAAWRVIWR